MVVGEIALVSGDTGLSDGVGDVIIWTGDLEEPPGLGDTITEYELFCFLPGAKPCCPPLWLGWLDLRIMKPGSPCCLGWDLAIMMWGRAC